jgi:hypothetical protein
VLEELMKAERRSRTVAAAGTVLAAGMVLAGCTSGAGAPPSHDGMHGSVSPRPTVGPGLTASKPPAASSWPDKAVLSHDAPKLGKTSVIRHGYTKATYLDALARRWQLVLEKPQLIDAPMDRKVWHFASRPQGGGTEVFTISGTPAENGDLKLFTCMAKADQAKARAFLEDCSRTGIPGWNAEKAAKWVDRSAREDDALYEKKHQAVVSPMFVSSRAYALLRKVDFPQEGGDWYELNVSGGGIAEDS